MVDGGYKFAKDGMIIKTFYLTWVDAHSDILLSAKIIMMDIILKIVNGRLEKIKTIIAHLITSLLSMKE